MSMLLVPEKQSFPKSDRPAMVGWCLLHIVEKILQCMFSRIYLVK